MFAKVLKLVVDSYECAVENMFHNFIWLEYLRFFYTYGIFIQISTYFYVFYPVH